VTELQALPVGTVTFLFTDIESSTRLLRELGRQRYEEVLALHNTLIRDAFAACDGIEVDRQGDGFFFVFMKASDAVRAAAGAQRQLAEARWPHVDAVRVRIGIHTGEAELGSEGYVGLAVHKAARLTKAGDGGQVLLSLTTVRLVRDELDPELELHDLGDWQPDGFEGRHRLYALTLDGTETTAVIPWRLRFTGRPDALHERGQELAAINRLIHEPPSGRFVAVDGRPGMGKTQLVLAARDGAARNGMQVLGARGAELEHEFGYGVVRQLFEPLLASLDAADEEQLLAGPAAFAGRLFREAELAAAPEGQDVGFAMLHGLYWLAVNIGARRPTLLTIDDLHWADAATLRWLCYLVPRLEGVPLALLVASRPPEMGREPALLEQILGDPNAVLLRPGALHNPSVASMVYAAFYAEPEDAFVDACREATGGNPLFLRALIEGLKDEGSDLSANEIDHVQRTGPQAVSRVIQTRLARLPTAVRSVADAVAVLGEDADLDAVAELASLDPRATEEAAAALALADVLRLERRLRFTHPVVRASVYEQIAPATRPQLHRNAAAVLASRSATPERVATHLLLSDPGADAVVVSTLREAAARSLAQGVSDGAIAYLRRALDESPPEADRAALLYELGSAELRVDGDAAAEHLRHAWQLEQGPVQRAHVALQYGRALWLTGEHPTSIEVFQSAIASLGDEQRELRERLEAELISSAWWEPEYLPIAIEHLQRIRIDELAGGLGSDMLLANLAFIGSRRGADLEGSREFARSALADGALQRSSTAALQYAALTLVMCEEFDEAIDVYNASLEEARRRGDTVTEAGVLIFRGFTKTRLGSLDEALEDLRAAVELARAAKVETTYPYATAFLAEALLEKGDVEGAAEALEALPLPRELPPSGHFFFLITARGGVRLAQGRREEGVRDLLSLGESVAQLHASSAAWGRWRGRVVRALLEQGDRDRALELANEDVDIARRWGGPRALGLAVMTQGLAEGGERGEVLLREAVEILEQSPAKLARAGALLELGAALRRRNKRSEAREPLRQALELATECCAPTLAAQARDELVAAGAKPRKAALSGAESLTPSELRVARLAVDGKTNREIAQSLFVTPKTVEVHLSSVYRKLGIASRTQLADALRGTVPVGDSP
jgi:class 3 adenylate cyclase/DNA-binding CsgD family transcriptional regulator/tetratricopeptide (TPR) repeat protein